jgi:hypothetical protein
MAMAACTLGGLIGYSIAGGSDVLTFVWIVALSLYALIALTVVGARKRVCALIHRDDEHMTYVLSSDLLGRPRQLFEQTPFPWPVSARSHRRWLEVDTGFDALWVERRAARIIGLERVWSQPLR